MLGGGPVISYRQCLGLKQLLTYNRLHSMDMEMGTKPCYKPRSPLCPHISSSNAGAGPNNVTHSIRVGGPSVSDIGDSLSFGGTTLAAKSEVRSLGIQLDLALTMKTQVASVVRSAYFHL